MDLGRALREIRRKKDKTQVDVTGKLKISQTYLSQIENGTKEPSAQMLRKLCKYYKVPVVIVMWMATETHDVEKKKQLAFNQIGPALTSLVNEILK
jgi:transcriptional regulator with XRE-family HTH domain